MKYQKKKNLRSTLDTDSLKIRKEVEELRKTLSDFKSEEADKIKKKIKTKV